MPIHAVGKPNIAMSSAGKSPRSALSERLLASNSPAEVAIDIPRPARPSTSASGMLRAANILTVRYRFSEHWHKVAGACTPVACLHAIASAKLVCLKVVPSSVHQGAQAL